MQSQFRRDESVRGAAIATACWVLAFSVPQAAALSLFQVGNSFTFDSMGLNSVAQPIGTELMLEAALGTDVVHAYHVRGNQTLDSLWSNPQGGGTFTTSYGDHTVALPNNAWDYLTVQTFPTISEPLPTLGEEISRIQDFVGAADQGGGGNTEIIVYGPWAARGEGSWVDWHESVVDDPATETNYSAAYHDLLYDKVAALYPGRTRLASAGKVIREVRDRILAGDAPIEASSDLYRDAIHMNQLGSFVASTTIQTSILGKSQVGQPVPRDAPAWVSKKRISDRQARWIQEVVWETMLSDSRSGVEIPVEGDFDGNGSIDFGDLWIYQRDNGSTDRLLADGNGDGIVNADDFTIWSDAVISLGGLDPAAGDLDGNGSIDTADLAMIHAAYGSTSQLVADANNDGVVNAIDYTVWRDAYDAPVLSIPEPMTVSLVSLVATALLVRRRVV